MKGMGGTSSTAAFANFSPKRTFGGHMGTGPGARILVVVFYSNAHHRGKRLLAKEKKKNISSELSIFVLQGFA